MEFVDVLVDFVFELIFDIDLYVGIVVLVFYVFVCLIWLEEWYDDFWCFFVEF